VLQVGCLTWSCPPRLPLPAPGQWHPMVSLQRSRFGVVDEFGDVGGDFRPEWSGQATTHAVDNHEFRAGMAAAVARPPLTSHMTSSAPCTTTVGTRSDRSQGRREEHTGWRPSPAATSALRAHGFFAAGTLHSQGEQEKASSQSGDCGHIHK
jgi:hypothetical protein